MKQIKLQDSIVTPIKFHNYNILIKRDDLLNFNFTGNKARKFQYFLENNFPDITTVISYGSNQSNAMYSLSVLAKLKKWQFIYYVHHIPTFLKNNPSGNYKYALENGMIIKEGNPPKTLQSNQLFINEGGAIHEASYGIKNLAIELKNYITTNNLKNIKIFLPSGTGTTALYLQKYLDNIEILTTPCVGDKIYLQQQFTTLEPNLHQYPTILTPPKKFHFGKLYKENYQIWLDIKQQTNIEFDLLYDPIGWQTLLYHQNKINLNNIIYIHQGGIIGNETMIERYHRKLSISSD